MFGDLFQLICQAAIRAFPPHPRQAILKRFHNGFRFRLTRLPGEFGCEMLGRGISYLLARRLCNLETHLRHGSHPELPVCDTTAGLK